MAPRPSLVEGDEPTRVIGSQNYPTTMKGEANQNSIEGNNLKEALIKSQRRGGRSLWHLAPRHRGHSLYKCKPTLSYDGKGKGKSEGRRQQS